MHKRRGRDDGVDTPVVERMASADRSMKVTGTGVPAERRAMGNQLRSRLNRKDLAHGLAIEAGSSLIRRRPQTRDPGRSQRPDADYGTSWRFRIIRWQSRGRITSL